MVKINGLLQRAKLDKKIIVAIDGYKHITNAMRDLVILYAHCKVWKI